MSFVTRFVPHRLRFGASLEEVVRPRPGNFSECLKNELRQRDRDDRAGFRRSEEHPSVSDPRVIELHGVGDSEPRIAEDVDEAFHPRPVLFPAKSSALVKGVLSLPSVFAGRFSAFAGFFSIHPASTQNEKNVRRR